MTVDDVGKKEREEKNKDDWDKHKANSRPLKRSLWIFTGPIGCIALIKYIMKLWEILFQQYWNIFNVETLNYFSSHSQEYFGSSLFQTLATGE